MRKFLNILLKLVNFGIKKKNGKKINFSIELDKRD
jgi:hypothetical protein